MTSQQVGTAPTTTVPVGTGATTKTPTGPITTTTSGLGIAPPQASSSSSSSGPIIGAVVGGGIGILLILLLVIFVLRRKKPNAVGFAEAGSEEIPASLINVKEVLSLNFFGSMFRGELKQASTKIVVCIRKPPQEASKGARKQFLTELALLRNLPKSPFIANFIGQCTKDQRNLMLLFELCENGNLRDFLRLCQPVLDLSGKSSAPLTAEDRLKFVHQIASGMAHLEASNIRHGDLSARTVLVTGDKVCKISDIGIHRRAYRSNALLPVRWMSPEALRSHSTFADKNDVWAYGVVYWEVFTYAATPYAETQDQDILRILYAGERLPRPSNASQDVYDAALMCWNANPNARPTFKVLADLTSNQINRPSSYETQTPFVQFSFDSTQDEPGIRMLPDAGTYGVLNRARTSSNDAPQSTEYDTFGQTRVQNVQQYSAIADEGDRYGSPNRIKQTNSQPVYNTVVDDENRYGSLKRANQNDSQPVYNTLASSPMTSMLAATNSALLDRQGATVANALFSDSAYSRPVLQLQGFDDEPEDAEGLEYENFGKNVRILQGFTQEDTSDYDHIDQSVVSINQEYSRLHSGDHLPPIASVVPNTDQDSLEAAYGSLDHAHSPSQDVYSQLHQPPCSLGQPDPKDGRFTSEFYASPVAEALQDTYARLQTSGISPLVDSEYGRLDNIAQYQDSSVISDYDQLQTLGFRQNYVDASDYPPAKPSHNSNYVSATDYVSGTPSALTNYVSATDYALPSGPYDINVTPLPPQHAYDLASVGSQALLPHSYVVDEEGSSDKGVVWGTTDDSHSHV